jgi:cytoskeletal protein CcmA (bactofilin family)
MKMEDLRGNLEIDGMGTCGGGEFDTVSICGIGTITSNISAKKIDVDGVGKFQGLVESDEIKVAGTASFKDEVKTNLFKVDGKGSVEKDISAKEVFIAGISSFKGNLKSEGIKIEGMCKVKGNCEAEVFDLEGQVKIGGQLNGDAIRINTFFKSEINEIVGSVIDIKRSGNIVADLFSNILGSVSPSNLAVNTIEGDGISIDYTNARTVRGENIVIGEHCEIGLIEYSGSLKQHPRAKVGETRKLDGKEG